MQDGGPGNTNLLGNAVVNTTVVGDDRRGVLVPVGPRLPPDPEQARFRRTTSKNVRTSNYYPRRGATPTITAPGGKGLGMPAGHSGDSSSTILGDQGVRGHRRGQATVPAGRDGAGDQRQVSIPIRAVVGKRARTPRPTG